MTALINFILAFRARDPPPFMAPLPPPPPPPPPPRESAFSGAGATSICSCKACSAAVDITCECDFGGRGSRPCGEGVDLALRDMRRPLHPARRGCPRPRG